MLKAGYNTVGAFQYIRDACAGLCRAKYDRDIHRAGRGPITNHTRDLLYNDQRHTLNSMMQNRWGLKITPVTEHCTLGDMAINSKWTAAATVKPF